MSQANVYLLFNINGSKGPSGDHGPAASGPRINHGEPNGLKCEQIDGY